ncbi:MAG TPA: HAD family hydrolase [Vicinamibacterales bacterium]|nr:HAD family hydrolase [Vicinamibacterales bacterium]
MDKRPAVFLDRDGTMVHDVGYLSRREDLKWFPYTIDAIRLLNRAGFLVFVTTNQGGIALGFCTETFVREVHDEMSAFVAVSGGRVDGWFFCPHHPLARDERLKVNCDCRKPRPGMIHQATEQFEIDLAHSFVVGDKVADVDLAAGVGARGILVRTGYGEAELLRHGGDVPRAAYVAAELMDATSWILTQAGHPNPGNHLT